MDSELDPRREQPERGRKANRNKKVGAVAAAAAIGLVTVAWILATRGEQDVATPPKEAAGATAVEVATGFLEAYGAFDVERATTYLADDAATAELVASIGAQGVQGTPNEFRLLVSWLEAVGYEQTLSSCEELATSPSGARVHCPFDYSSLRSDEIGLEPFSGSAFDLIVRDGEVTRVSVEWATDEFSPQVWEPFASWVSTAYPDDAAVMYQDETYSTVRLTEESIRLWERHSREYVDEVVKSA